MIVVEVLGRGGRVEQRVKIAAFPATIGRSYAADIILDDPFADAVHARLVQEESGALAVEDAGSVNGLYEREHGVRLGRIPLVPGATFQLGHTVLRVVTPDTPVAPAIPEDRRGSSLRRALHTRRVAAALTVGGTLLFGVQFYLSSTETAPGTAFVEGALAMLAVALAWAGAWALGTRIRSGQARFLAHLSVTWLAFLVLLVLGVGESWYRFFAGDVWSADAVGFVTFVAAVAAPVYGSLAIASRMRRVARLLIGAAAAMLVFGLAKLGEMGESFRGSWIAVSMPLKPVPAALVPAESPEAFLARIDALQADVDREAATGDDAEGENGASPEAPAPDSAQ